LIQLISSIISIYYWLIIIRVLLSWFPTPSNDFVISIYEFLYQATEPYLGLFRRFIPTMGAVDISPIVAILVLFMIRNALVGAF